MQPDPHALQISVDGSCLAHDGRKSGYAGVVAWPDGRTEEIVFRGFKESTNQRMEIAACVAAMDWVRETYPRPSRVQIFSDSMYVIDNIPRSCHWQQNGWRNADGRPIQNHELWKEFLAARKKAGVRIDFGWVPGKSTPVLKMVDKAAKRAAQSGIEIDRGYRPGKIGRARTKGGVATMFPAAGQVASIRIYASRVVGKDKEDVIKFETYEEATQQCGAKYFAYAERGVAAELHRHHAYRVQMNDKPKYPQILAMLEEIPLPKKPKRAVSVKIVSISAAKP